MRSSMLILAAVALAMIAGQGVYAGSDTMAVEPYTFAAADFEHPPWTKPLMPAFEAAAAKYNVPLSLLLTLGYYGSAFENRGAAPTVEGGYGLMALRKNILGADSLGLGAKLTGTPEDTLRTDPAASIDAGAAVLDNYATKWQIDRSAGLSAWLQPIIDFAGLDDNNSKLFAWEVFSKLKMGLETTVNQAGEAFQFDPQDIGSMDLASLVSKAAATQSTDYGPAIWNPATDCNYDPAVHPSDTVVLHTSEGTLAGCIAEFQNCSRTASSHYVVGADGTVVQMVREAQTAWDVSCYNYRSIGIEQEGTAASATHPVALYNATSALVRDICNRLGIPKQHNVVGPGIIGHIDVTNNACGTHTDPGTGWDWEYCMQQITQAGPTDQVYIEPRGQHSSYYSDDGSSYWGNSSSFCNSFDSRLTSGGSRVFPNATASPSGHWIQAKPVLAIPGGTYEVDIAHAGPTSVSTNIVTSLSITNATRISADPNTWTNTAFQSANSCVWAPIALIKLNAGQTQPTVRLTYSSGTAGDTSHQWSIEGIRFTSIPYPSTLTLTACPSVGGTITGAGLKSAGDSVTVTAIPNTGYTFVSWTTGGCAGTVVSTSVSYSFSVPGQDYSLFANFAATGPVMTAAACGGGSTSGGGVYSAGQSVTVAATASQGYTFGNWSSGGCGGAVLSSSLSYTFNMPAGDYTVYANFTPGSYSLPTTSCGNGTASGGGTYLTGQSVTVTASPAPGYCLTGWTTDGCGGSNIVSQNTTYTFNMPGSNYTLYANFAKGLFYDDFETYGLGGNSPDSLDKNDPMGANQASNGSGNPWWGPAAPNGRVTGPLNGVSPHHGNRMVFATSGWAKNCVNIAYRFNGGSAFTGGVYLDWWFYDPVGAGGNNTTFFNEYHGIGYYTNVPTTMDYPSSLPSDESPYQSQQLVIGASDDWNTGYDASKYQVRVVGDASGYHNGWSNTSAARSTGWHHARIIVGPRKSPSNTNDVSFYIDNMSSALLTKDSTTTVGYNVIELNLAYPRSGNYFSSIRSGELDEVTFGKAPNAPGSANPSSPAPDQIVWNWVDNSNDEDGFAVWDSAPSIKGTAPAGFSSWTETGLAANTAYARTVSAFTNIAGSALHTVKVSLPTAYTLAAPPVYGTSGNGAVSCNKGSGSSSGWYPTGAAITFSAVNGFGTGASKAGSYVYVWDQSPGEPTWTSPTPWTSGALTPPTVAAGSYYLHLRACNSNGIANTTTLTLGPYVYKAPTPVSRIGDLWPSDNTTPLSLAGKTVTAVVPGAFWVEETDRTAAIKVLYAGTVTRDHLVNVYGTLDSSGPQRTLIAGSVDDLGAATPIAALAMVERALNGGGFNASTPGMTDGVGLYNIGMLARIAGRVTYTDASDPHNVFFYLDDGSGLTDGSHAGVKVLCGSIAPPAAGKAIVSGIIDTATVANKIVPVLVIRDSADMRAL